MSLPSPPFRLPEKYLNHPRILSEGLLVLVSLLTLQGLCPVSTLARSAPLSYTFTGHRVSRATQGPCLVLVTSTSFPQSPSSNLGPRVETSDFGLETTSRNVLDSGPWWTMPHLRYDRNKIRPFLSTPPVTVGIPTSTVFLNPKEG